MMNQHISKIARVAFYHIRRLRKVRSILGAEITAGLVSAFILSRLDDYSAALSHLLASTIAPLQRVHSAAARLIKDLRPGDIWHQHGETYIGCLFGILHSDCDSLAAGHLGVNDEQSESKVCDNNNNKQQQKYYWTTKTI